MAVFISGALSRANDRWLGKVRRALVFIKPYKRTVILVLGLVFMVSAFEAIEPLILKYLFDRLDAGKVNPLLIGIGGLMALGVSREIVQGFSNWYSWRVRLGVNYGLLEATVSRLHTLPLAYHRNESVGGIMTKLDRGINGLVEALSNLAFGILPGLFYLCLSLFFMFRLDWRLSLVVLAFAPAPTLIGMWAACEQTTRERALVDRWTSIFSRFNEVLSGILTVKSFSMEDEEKRRFLSGVDDANALVLRGVGTDTKTGAVKNFAILLARVFSIALGGYLIIKGQITMGTLIAFLGYLTGLFGPVQGLTGIYQTIRKASVSVDIIYSILDARDGLRDLPQAKAVKSVSGEVVFDGVSFGYQKEKSILLNIDLRIKPGETVALVGPSGAGKTTLMALLQRFYDPIEGSIRIDGVDLRHIKQRSLRKHIGVVFQDALLFNDTVRNNIAYGRPGAPERDIIEAAKAANAHDFITRFPEGYDTLAGERGGRLSAGERQRVSIARALLKNPPILILDEATSALDAESEFFVQEALSRLVKGRTTFIIAHRLSTVMGADRILVLKDGTIMESGCHQALMGRNGYYAAMVKRQTGGLLIAPAA